MYIKSIQIKNYGPINELQYNFKFDQDGNPLPLVLVGGNGSGKTFFISNIVNFLIENKRKSFPYLKEVDGDFYYKPFSTSNILAGKNYYYVSTEFSDGCNFVELVTRDLNEFKNLYGEGKEGIRIDLNDSQLINEGIFFKCNPSTMDEIVNSVYLYFPTDRSYLPGWRNKFDNKPKAKLKERYSHYSDSNIICFDLLADLESWLLDLIIDKELYEKKLKDGILSYSGKNTNILRNINIVLSEIFKKRYKAARIAITPKDKGYRFIYIVGRVSDTFEEEIVPSFAQLSSGEVMIFSIACSILKAYDSVTNTSNLEDIKGVVLIDEIDAHLHFDFSKDIAPKLIKLFPGIQFIVSSHSPFFLLGMVNEFKDRLQVLTMPEGLIADDVDHLEEIQKCYSLIYDDHAKLIKTLDEYRKMVQNIKLPLVITEGKTDWMHLEHAFNEFKSKGEFTDLEVKFCEFKGPMGDKLLDVLNNAKYVKSDNVIIGVIDTDKHTIDGDYERVGNESNKVFCCKIPNPNGYVGGNSIEMLYSEKDIKTVDSEGRRLFLSNEFDPVTGFLLSPTDELQEKINCRNKLIASAKKENKVKIIDCGVFCGLENKDLALSKNAFARYICDKTPPFDKVSIEGFRGFFETLREIISYSN